MRKIAFITSLLAVACAGLLVFKHVDQENQTATQNQLIAQNLAKSELTADSESSPEVPISLPDALPGDEPVAALEESNSEENDSEEGQSADQGKEQSNENPVRIYEEDYQSVPADIPFFNPSGISSGNGGELPAATEPGPDTLTGNVGGFLITEYAPAREKDFSGALVSAPGLAGKHRADWLYSASGVMMEGDGVGLDGKNYYLANGFGRSWLAKDGSAGGNPFWTNSAYWKNVRGQLTTQTLSGWSNGSGISYIAPAGEIRFSRGRSRPLKEYRSIAVDPKIIPLGSKVYIPAYKNSPNKGWFVAEDTGTSIKGKHIDVYREGAMTTHENQKIQIVLT